MNKKQIIEELTNVETDMTLKIGELQYKLYRLIEDRHVVTIQIQEKKRGLMLYE